MNFNFINDLSLCKLFLINQNNPPADWLILLGMRKKKKNIISERIGYQFLPMNSSYSD